MAGLAAAPQAQLASSAALSASSQQLVQQQPRQQQRLGPVTLQARCAIEKAGAGGLSGTSLCQDALRSASRMTRKEQMTCSVASVAAAAAVVVTEGTTSYGVAEMQGTARPVMEDRFAVSVDASGNAPSYYAVFDGHGGFAVAEFLTKDLWQEYKKQLAAFPKDLVKATEKAYAATDKRTLAAPKGFFGALMERGLGGSKCGSCANTAVILPSASGRVLVAANVGDGRTILCRGGQAVQLSFDHKPDLLEERRRIEAKNPTPLKPLVRQQGGEWRVGGLLALSRAFGDAYLKDWTDGTRDGARGGFGLTAEPTIAIENITADDQWLILASDGLTDVISNQEVVDYCIAEGAKGAALKDISAQLAQMAVARGSKDDVTVIVVRL